MLGPEDNTRQSHEDSALACKHRGPYPSEPSPL